MSKPFRGIFTIPATPFTEDLQVDWDGLRRVVEFCVGCGAHGLVWPVNASAFYVLSDEERLKGMEVVVEQAAGRAPVVIGTRSAVFAPSMWMDQTGMDSMPRAEALSSRGLRVADCVNWRRNE